MSGRTDQHGVTMGDVARRAKVSLMTVSRVINGSPRVDDRTRASVLKAINELKFRPNRAARNLASAAEPRIGLIRNNPSVAYFSELLIGAVLSSGSNAAQLVVDKCPSGDMEAERKAVRKLVRAGVSGMLLTAPASDCPELIKELNRAGVAPVAIATAGFKGDVTCVGIDDFRAAYDLTRFLVKLGHRRIGFIKGHPNHGSSRRRLHGFLAGLREADAPCETPRLAQGMYCYRSGLKAAERLLRNAPRPTAIFASNDDMASGVIAVAHRMGLDVPRDLSIVGFDDTTAVSAWPALTTIRQPIHDIGSTAVDVIVRNLRTLRAGHRPEPREYVVPHALIERDSAAPPRVNRRA